MLTFWVIYGYERLFGIVDGDIACARVRAADVQTVEELSLSVLSRLEEVVVEQQRWREIAEANIQLLRDLAFQEWLCSQSLEHYYHTYAFTNITLNAFTLFSWSIFYLNVNLHLFFNFQLFCTMFNCLVRVWDIDFSLFKCRQWKNSLFLMCPLGGVLPLPQGLLWVTLSRETAVFQRLTAATGIPLRRVTQAICTLWRTALQLYVHRGPKGVLASHLSAFPWPFPANWVLYSSTAARGPKVSSPFGSCSKSITVASQSHCCYSC